MGLNLKSTWRDRKSTGARLFSLTKHPAERSLVILLEASSALGGTLHAMWAGHAKDVELVQPLVMGFLIITLVVTSLPSVLIWKGKRALVYTIRALQVLAAVHVGISVTESWATAVLLLPQFALRCLYLPKWASAFDKHVPPPEEAAKSDNSGTSSLTDPAVTSEIVDPFDSDSDGSGSATSAMSESSPSPMSMVERRSRRAQSVAQDAARIASSVRVGLTHGMSMRTVAASNMVAKSRLRHGPSASMTSLNEVTEDNAAQVAEDAVLRAAKELRRLDDAEEAKTQGAAESNASSFHRV
jgi:hypothetical protein